MEENVIYISSGITINVNASVENVMYVKGLYLSPATCSCENGKYLASIMDDSAITCDEVIVSYNEKAKPITTKLDEMKATCKMQNFCFTCIFMNLESTIDSC